PFRAGMVGEPRRNREGLDRSDRAVVSGLAAQGDEALEGELRSAPIIGGREGEGTAAPVLDPSDRSVTVGQVVSATPADVARAIDLAIPAQRAWALRPVEERAEVLFRLADALEHQRHEFFALAQREAGKTLGDALGEVREAVDFCRYYAAEARRVFAPSACPDRPGSSTN